MFVVCFFFFIFFVFFFFLKINSSKINFSFNFFFFCYFLTDVTLDGKVHCATNVNRILAVYMALVKRNGNAIVTKDGVACSVIKI